MTDLQIAVAKAIGWDKCREENPCSGWHNYSIKQTPPDFHKEPPHLTLDLMWEAEEMLVGDERWKYAEELINNGSYWRAFHTTAEERAKAWLKVKGISVE